MADELVEMDGARVLVCAAEGPLLRSDQDVVGELFGLLYEHDPDVVAVPVERLDPGFFTLRSGVAGAVVSKLAGYGRRAVFVGDITAQLAASESLQAWVRECNRTRDIWFVADLVELGERLSPGTVPARASPRDAP
jgi:hypothetical protein